MENQRLSWPETWITIAKTIAERSYDPTLKVGAIVVSEDNTQMLSIGYNGNYRGGPHERESSSPGQSGFIHAEANALVKCDFNFHKKKHMYLTHSPCRACSKLIVNAEIARIVYDIPYRDASGLEILTSAGIEVFSLRDAIIRSRVL
ncbi:MAG: deoxycytidylate deaminase [Chlamydiae bacterium]|nr:deoxycytidylate deaminase [Chlamydiota bacterium]